ncbi:MAG: response regulator, partial [Ectothiorhodospiraceae bacterium]
MTEVGRPAVLVVDDEPGMQELLSELLEDNGFRVQVAASGEEMEQALDRRAFALVILDLRLPGEDGLALARRLRERSTIPIMMLTGKGDETDRIVGLELAADDFLMKPFNNRELVARVRAMLRRATELSSPGGPRDAAHHERYAFGEWIVDLTSRELLDGNGSPRSLTTGEFSLLEAFVRSPNRVLSRDQLLERTRGYDADVFDRTIDVLILRL